MGNDAVQYNNDLDCLGVGVDGDSRLYNLDLTASSCLVHSLDALSSMFSFCTC